MKPPAGERVGREQSVEIGTREDGTSEDDEGCAHQSATKISVSHPLDDKKLILLYVNRKSYYLVTRYFLESAGIKGLQGA